MTVSGGGGSGLGWVVGGRGLLVGGAYWWEGWGVGGRGLGLVIIIMCLCYREGVLHSW